MIKKSISFLFVIVISVFFSCDKEDDLIKEDNFGYYSNSATVQRVFEGDSIILDNPYSKTNMIKALTNIKAKNPNSSFIGLNDFKIVTSHLYIKFKPNTVEEESLLKRDTTMHLLDYRLDCEYKDEYLDKRRPTIDSITDYYVAIPVDKNIPNVPYEIIEELYIPEQDNYFDDTYDNEKYLITGIINDKTDLFNNLIYEAFVITGNEDEVKEEGSTENQRWFFGSRWRPKGTLKIWDSDRRSLVPLEGAQVLMRQWFTITNGISSSTGYFQTSRVRGHARYIIQWERYHYSIRSGTFGQAELRGPKWKKRDWNHDINSGAHLFYGTIHRGAHHYYYKDIKGLRRPPLNSTLATQMKIGAYNETSATNGNYNCQRGMLGILPAIKIYNPQNNSSEIYGTTIHELAHASHKKMNFFAYGTSSSLLKESWARGVQRELTRMTYSSYTPSYFGNYTGVVQDMIDSDLYYGNTFIVGDNVSGYTIRQLEDALYNKNTWSLWRDNIKNLYNNGTENNLDLLFNYWD